MNARGIPTLPVLRGLTIPAALRCGLAPSFAASRDEIITRWNAMLVAANADGLAPLLSDEAVIDIQDLGIQQDRAEFPGTLGEWRSAIAGGGIRHKVEKTEGDVTTVLACYDFAENDILMRETFKIDAGLIGGNTQVRVAEDCNAY
jgi:hypothetical protein